MTGTSATRKIYFDQGVSVSSIPIRHYRALEGSVG